MTTENNVPYGVVYAITCVATGKQYVGQTTRPLLRRWADHKKDAKRSNTVLGKSILKYGGDAFHLRVLDTAENSADLDAKEVVWITSLNTRVPNGYNLTPGGSGVTPESRAKQSLSHKGWVMSPEAREKIRQSKLGKKMSPEAIEKSRLGHLGRRDTEDQREKKRIASTGRKHSPETKEKIRLAHLGRKCTPEHVEKNRITHLKANRTPEGVEKSRLGALKQWEDRRAGK